MGLSKTHCGDCLEILRTLPAASVDSLVTDPPAGISFMSKSWDGDKGGREQWVAWLTDVMREAYRVLKPGAHGLVWAIPRTSHWTATALENAGFEVRDVVTHLFGTGFPKSLDVSKAIDKAAGAKRPVIGKIAAPASKNRVQTMGRPDHSGSGWQDSPDLTAPATDAARKWQGFGTALKPASEHWILVRKPLGEKTVAANVLKHGVGAINVDGCRIEGEPDRPTGLKKDGSRSQKVGNDGWDRPWKNDERANRVVGDGARATNLGRFPANLVLSHNDDCEEVGTKKVKPGNGSGRASKSGASKFFGTGEDATVKGRVDDDGTETVTAWHCTPGCAVAELDGQSGVLKSGDLKPGHKQPSSAMFRSQGTIQRTYGGDAGGASRFFYCSKASKSDRGNDNTHPTVKSTKLMRYLVRLVTPPGGAVLDPFMGSGSTGVAAKAEGMAFVGIEQDAAYHEIASRRTGVTA